MRPCFDEEGREVCARSIESVKGRGCGDRHCTKSHKSIVIDASLLAEGDACLELKNLLLCVADVHSPAFLWKNERYIEELFSSLSVKRHMDCRSVRCMCQLYCASMSRRAL